MKIAILGLGVVGRGVYDIVQEELSPEVEVKYILDLRPLEDIRCIHAKSIQEIVCDPEVDLVVETMGGLHPAYEFNTAALKAGKSVVTANKHFVSTYYRELHELAAEKGVFFEYTPSAGGGIPWLFNLSRTRRCGKIESFNGIINGTTNYILDKMTKTGTAFETALRSAQELGYAEADPSADIDGLDVQRKCAISANRAFDSVISPEDIPTAGIRFITDRDIAAFRERHLVCRLICCGREQEGKISAYVEPTLFAEDALEAHVPDNNNLITLNAKYAGRLSFYGQGAGRYPTAHSLVEDIRDIRAGQAPLPSVSGGKAMDNSGVSHAYYVRGGDLSFLDGLVSETLGEGVITVPLSVERMHRLAAGELAKGTALFFAGLAG